MTVSNEGATMGDAAAQSVQLNLIGGFELVVGGETADLADPARRLMAYLALHRAAQPRALVAGSLWPDKPEARALANLRSALWTLQDRGQPLLVDSRAASLRLHAAVCVDVHVVHAAGWSLIERARTDIGGAASGLVDSRLVTNPELLLEDLLPGWYDDWVLLERERFAELQFHVLDVLVPTLTEAARYPLAIHLALRLVALDPLRERSQLALIRAYLAEGSFGRAKRQHRAFCELLESSFGCDYERSFSQVLTESAPLSPRR
jgi:DNA-binding SARP family transcriptional activator